MRRRVMKGIAGLLGGLLIALTPTHPANASDGVVVVSLSEDGGGVYTLRGTFTVPASNTCAWDVLTDYSHLGSFIPTVKSSIVKRQGPNSLLVAQENTTWVLAFSRKTQVLLQVEQEPASRIEFSDVSQSDFELYRGSWEIDERADGTHVDYMASAKPRFMPPMVGKKIFLDTVRDLLVAVRREIIRRRDQP